MSEAAKWGTLEIDVPPPFLEPIIDGLISFLEIFSVLCDILLVLLNIVKVFLVGLVSPILVIIDAIIALLESLVADFRQAGLYFRGDWSLASAGWSNFVKETRGGFSKFESRVFEWFTDKSDTQRPDISTASGVLAMFFYVSVDVSEIEKMIKLIMKLVRFFQAVSDAPSPLVPAVNLKSEYIAKIAGLDVPIEPGQLSTLESVPKVMKVSWDWASQETGGFSIPFTMPKPYGALVEVSTVPELLVGYSQVPTGATPRTSGIGGGDPPRQKGFFEFPVQTGGGPMKLYGGLERLAGPLMNRNFNDPNATRFAFVVQHPRDTNPIGIKEWMDANPLGLQRTFYAERGGFGSLYSGNQIRLNPEHFPFALKSVSDGVPTFEDKPAREVYVRVTPISEEAVKSLSDSAVDMNESASGPIYGGDLFLKWRLDDKNDAEFKRQGRMMLNGTLDNTAHGSASEAVVVSAPSQDMLKFLQMVESAVLITLSSAANLEAEEVAKNNNHSVGGDLTLFCAGLEKVAKPLYDLLDENAWNGDYQSSAADAGNFWRVKCKEVAKEITDRFMNGGGGALPDSIISSLVESHYEKLCGQQTVTATGVINVDGSGTDIPLMTRIEDGAPVQLKASKALIVDFFECGGWATAAMPSKQANIWGVHKNVEALLTYFPKEAADQAKARSIILKSLYSPPADQPTGEQAQLLTPGETAAQVAAEVAAGAAEGAVVSASDEVKTGSIQHSWDLGGFHMGITQAERIKSQIPVMIVATGPALADKSPFDPTLSRVSDTAEFEAQVNAGNIVVWPARILTSDMAKQSAAAVLGVTNRLPIRHGEWVALRPFENFLDPLDKVLQEILDVMYAIRKGLAAALEMIMKYIRMIEMKIREVQALIRKIQALLQMIKDLSISGDFGLLMVSSAGTSGALADFMNAENKPSDGRGACGAGMVALAGGWPLILVELIEALVMVKESNNDDGEAAEEGDA